MLLSGDRFLAPEEGMGHFDVAFCADFVRGIVGADDRTALERHIETCRPCAANLQWLLDLAALTAVERQYEPPAELLVRADAMFATGKLQGNGSPDATDLVGSKPDVKGTDEGAAGNLTSV
jgi:anti-sigma-K factor RskA